MKTIFFATVFLIMLFLLPIVADASKKGTNYKIKTISTFLPLGTGSSTGTYFPMGMALASTISQFTSNINVMAISTKGSIENIHLLKKQEIKMALAQSDVFYRAVNNLKEFKKGSYKNLRGILSLYPEVVQIVVNDKSSIKNINDLRNKRIILGPRGSGNLNTALDILRAFDITLDDFTPGYLSYDQAVKALENHKYDAFILLAGIPTKVIVELKSRINIKILSLSEQEVKTVVDKLEYFSSQKIGPNTYNNQHTTINTVALRALLVVDNTLKKETILEIMDAIFNNINYLKRIHPLAKDISLKNYRQGIALEYLSKASKDYYQRNIKNIPK